MFGVREAFFACFFNRDSNNKQITQATMNAPVYKRAGVEDIPTIIELTHAFALEYAGQLDADHVAQWKAQLREYYPSALIIGDVLCWYAAVDGIPVGLGAINVRQQYPSLKNISGKVGYVFNMFTHQQYRRMGIAATILTTVVASAQELGIRAFELHATNEGEPVYLKHGFGLHPEPTYRMYR
jgi:GNAT superfamily N-acetyltransferase